MKTLYETARDSLIVIESIASGSTTTNSLPHLARLAREGLTAIESADRAQQGEPVATEQSYSFRTRPLDAVGRVNGEWSGWMECTREQYNEGIPSPWPREIEYRAATKAASPADAPIHVEYDRIVQADERAMRAADALDGMGFTYDEEIGWLPPVPDTGIPTAGEVEKINMAQAGVGERARGYCQGWNECVDAHAAPSDPSEAKAGEDA